MVTPQLGKEFYPLAYSPTIRKEGEREGGREGGREGKAVRSLFLD
jgi:hypothetical protein